MPDQGFEIIIADYDPAWPELYEREKRVILDAIGPWLADIQHVGSTSVPGLAAKPIVDIMPGLCSLDDAPHIIEPMARAGYEYVPEFEDVLPERRYFRKPPGPERKWRRDFHVHVVAVGTAFWKRHIAFRDYLRAHPDVAEEYAELKRKLADEHQGDREGYTDAKTGFIRSVEAKALSAG